jgi:hypothetical protein
MEQPEKELIKEIANLFEDYEEAYVPGEWEAFSEQQKRKYPFFRNILKLAAVLILGFATLPFLVPKLFETADQPVLISLSKPSAPKNGSIIEENILAKEPDFGKNALNTRNAAGRSKVEQHISPARQDGVLTKERNVKAPEASVRIPVVQLPIAPEQMIASRITKEELKSIAAEANFTSEKNVITVEVKETPRIKESTAVPGIAEKVSTMDFLASESKQSREHNAAKGQLSKWDFGLAFAPSITSTSMNIGGGLTTAYRLSDKFSLSSGVSLLQLQSAIDVPPTAQSKMAVSALSSKELLAVDANIRAIDIPLAIVYNINKNFYTSAGLSYFNVISEKRSNTYQQASASVQSSADPTTGFASEVRTVVSQTLSEPAQETQLKGNSYLGFFNFSIGRKQNIFNKYNVLIEPFIKIPMGKLSAEDLKLTNSGLKFQFSF